MTQLAGFVDVLLRGLVLCGMSLALGGVAWLTLVRRVEWWAKPDRASAASLHMTALAAWAAAAGQAAVLLVALADLATHHAGWPLGAFLETTYAGAGLVRIVLGAAAGALAWRLRRRPAGRGPWLALVALAVALVASSAVLSHAMARVEGRALLVLLDALHQLAAATWIGGLAHLVLHAGVRARDPEAPDPQPAIRRFSTLALGAVTVLAAAGLALAGLYVGQPSAVVGTAYGVMVSSKTLLFVAALTLARANFTAVRRREGGLRLARYVEVELGLGITVLFAAASLTALPPAVDVTADRATVAEVAGRFVPQAPRVTSPPVAELNRAADPLMAPPGERKQIEREWSEYNHHWAGLFVLAMGLLASAERLGLRGARHWPLLFLGLGAFLFVRNDPRAWPLGPAGFWESMILPDVLQHRVFVLLVVAFGIFEWAVRTRRLPARPWGYVFPLLCAAGGGLLLTHSHAMFNLKQEFLTEVTHTPLGLLGAFAGWARWLEVRLPEAGRAPGWLWRVAFSGVGIFLLIYREG